MLLFVVLASTAASLRADPVWSVRAEMLVVRVPQSAGLRLRPILREAKTVPAGVAELHAMIARNAAELIGAPVLWMQSNQRGVTETVEEIRYPTEFVWHSVPQNFNPVSGYVPAPPPPSPYFPFSLPFDVPIAFETRNVGVTLEMEPTVGPGGQLIDVNIVPQHVSYEGVTRLFSTTGGNDWRYQQPKFRFLRTTTVLTCRSGEWQLVNVSVLREPARTLEFFLLRVTALPVHP